MPDNQAPIKIGRNQPGYVTWRGQLLAELALARVPGLFVHKRPDGAPADWPYDFLVAAEQGVCFFVVVDGFASFRMSRGDVRSAEELHRVVDADLIRRARSSQSPFLLFLFDADTEHGRFLRLDALPDPGPQVESLPVKFPKENAITKESLVKLIADLQAAPNRGVSAAPA